jgi:hypothetical protein
MRSSVIRKRGRLQLSRGLPNTRYWMIPELVMFDVNTFRI